MQWVCCRASWLTHDVVVGGGCLSLTRHGSPRLEYRRLRSRMNGWNTACWHVLRPHPRLPFFPSATVTMRAPPEAPPPPPSRPIRQFRHQWRHLHPTATLCLCHRRLSRREPRLPRSPALALQRTPTLVGVTASRPAETAREGRRRTAAHTTTASPRASPPPPLVHRARHLRVGAPVHPASGLCRRAPGMWLGDTVVVGGVARAHTCSTTCVCACVCCALPLPLAQAAPLVHVVRQRSTRTRRARRRPARVRTTRTS